MPSGAMLQDLIMQNGAPLHATTELRKKLLDPLLHRLREEKCAHMWQPSLAAAPKSDAYSVVLRLIAEGRPSTVFTYFYKNNENDEAVAVAALSPRISNAASEDGIPVLGRTYVNPEFRGQSIYQLILQHRINICFEKWGGRLLGVHIGTSSSRVENVFRKIFSGRVIKIGVEDLGEAGEVSALLGITTECDRQIFEKIPSHLERSHQRVVEFLHHGDIRLTAREVLPDLQSLIQHQRAFRVLHQFLVELPNLK